MSSVKCQQEKPSLLFQTAFGVYLSRTSILTVKNIATYGGFRGKVSNDGLATVYLTVSLEAIPYYNLKSNSKGQATGCCHFEKLHRKCIYFAIHSHQTSGHCAALTAYTQEQEKTQSLD